MKTIYLTLYYTLLQFLPMQPFPGYSFFYSIRYFFFRRIVCECGDGVIVKSKAYFGDGSRLKVGDRSQIGQNCRLGGSVSIGSDVLMGPDVVVMATSHEFSDLAIPINLQGESLEQPVIIGDDVWVGTRVIILPGVSIGSHSVVAAGAVVTKSVEPFSIVGGVPAKVIGIRK